MQNSGLCSPAMLISLLTGFAAGAVHVVGGADHLVAMAPFSLNRPLAACRSALAWTCAISQCC